MRKIIRIYRNRFYRAKAWFQIYGKKKLSNSLQNRIVLSAIIGVVALGLIFIFTQNPQWKTVSGLFEFTTPSGEYYPGKTVWDWLDLLIVPLSLAIVAYLLNRDQKKKDQVIAQDESRQKTLQNYFGEISKLLLERQLRDKNREAQNIAQAITLTTLIALDGSKKGLLIRFLYESKLIDKDEPIIRLEDGDLTEVVLSRMTLFEASFVRANLSDAKLTYSVLSNANFEKSNLYGANLIGVKGSGVNFIGSNLERAILYSASLVNAELMSTNFSHADLRGVNFTNANLRSAHFKGALLGRVRVKVANFTGAILDNVDFTDSDVTYEQLSCAKSLDGAIMPNGKIYDPKIHIPINSKN